MVLLGHALGCSLGILFRKGEGDMQYDDPRLMGVLVHLVTIEFPASLKRCKLYYVVIFQLKNASLLKKETCPKYIQNKETTIPFAYK
jgi:hypothetical protein